LGRRVNTAKRSSSSAPKLRRLVFAELGFNFRGVRSRIGPGVYEVFRSQRRIGREQPLFANAERARLLQEPDGYPRPHNARFTPTYIGPGIETWEG
jgi:hypothetical protein